MSKYTKVVDGKIATDTDVTPPRDWTNDYEKMGGDLDWGEDGEVSEFAAACGLDGEAKPLFGIEDYTGESMAIFKVSDKHYLYNRIDRSLFEIQQPTDLQDIASMMDADGGPFNLDLEQIA